jgi:hypothetical protein
MPMPCPCHALCLVGNKQRVTGCQQTTDSTRSGTVRKARGWGGGLSLSRYRLLCAVRSSPFAQISSIVRRAGHRWAVVIWQNPHLVYSLQGKLAVHSISTRGRRIELPLSVLLTPFLLASHIPIPTLSRQMAFLSWAKDLTLSEVPNPDSLFSRDVGSANLSKSGEARSSAKDIVYYAHRKTTPSAAYRCYTT